MTAERTVRRFLDSPWLWRGVAWIGLVLVVVALFYVNQRTSRALARTEAAAHAQQLRIQASADATYAACVRSMPLLRKTNRFIRGVQREHRTLLLNALAAHRVEPEGTRLYRQQVRNIVRLRAAVTDVTGVTFHVPTVAECRAHRAAELGLGRSDQKNGGNH